MSIYNLLFKKYVDHGDTGDNDSQFKTNNRAIHSKEQRSFHTGTVNYIFPKQRDKRPNPLG